MIANYDNLLYACRTCNSGKSSALVPDPHCCAYGRCLRVHDDGTIHALNPEGTILIDELDLDDTQRNIYRKLIIASVQLAAQHGQQELLERYLGLPSNLPDLKSRPPGGNTRPDGLRMSWHARRERGEVPPIIE